MYVFQITAVLNTFLLKKYSLSRTKQDDLCCNDPQISICNPSDYGSVLEWWPAFHVTEMLLFNFNSNLKKLFQGSLIMAKRGMTLF